MNINTIAEIIKKLNENIQSGVKSVPNADVIALFCLSAKRGVYLRENDICKLKNIESEIDDAIITYGKNLIKLKLPA